MNARFTTGPRLMVGACLVGFGLAGCQSSGTSRTLMAEEPAMPQSEYVIGPGDTLQIFVWQHPEVSVTIPVRPDGRVSTPLVEDVVAVGKTPTQLSRDLEVQNGQYIREPTVNVIVTSFIGTFGNQVRVVGQAVQPQAIPFRQDMTLLDVIIQVGGLSPNAAGNRAKIIRRSGSQEQEIPVRIQDLLNDGDTSRNLPMQPGDVLIIPESWL